MKKFLMLTLVAGSIGLMGASPVRAASGCACEVSRGIVNAAATAKAPQVQSQRSYSYDPGMNSYRAPAARRFSTNDSQFRADRKILGK